MSLTHLKSTHLDPDGNEENSLDAKNFEGISRNFFDTQNMSLIAKPEWIRQWQRRAGTVSAE